MSKQKFWVVIPAAGVGSRMQADRPKQYLPLNGCTVIEHTLGIFSDHPRINGIVVAISSEDEYWRGLALDSNVPIVTVEGGQERADSVLNALSYLLNTLDESSPDDWVLVHDAARPCLAANDLDLLMDTLAEDEVGGILAMPVRDTMKRAGDKQRIAHTESRAGLWHALTPQMFRLGALQAALGQALSEEDVVITDEASAMEFTDHQPKLVEGQASNIKITRPADLILAEFFLSQDNR